jgi:alkylation response protein AidB-like acyl-CoA dehydrogenase
MVAALAYKLAEEVVREGIIFLKERGVRHQVVKHRIARAWALLYAIKNNKSDNFKVQVLLS